MSPSVRAVFLHIFVAPWCALAGEQVANEFLVKRVERNDELVSALEEVLGPDSLRLRIDKLEVHLKPIFASLPRNGRQLLSHAAARYALHRTIGDLHGWSIAGLEPNATTFNTTSLVGSGILRGLVPSAVEDIFESYIDAHGFSLRHLAILASTIEYLVHEDQRFILRRVCELFDLPTVGSMNAEQMRKMILMYKAVFLIGGGGVGLDISKFTANDATRLLRTAQQRYPGWDDTVIFVDDEIETLAFQEQSLRNPFTSRESSLQVALRVVERVADHFARKLAEAECQEIREDLLTYELGSTGRIRLADFYRASMDARFFYTETKDFLQAIGAIDNSDIALGPRVIVANYVLAKTNCLAHSNTYNICCLNECESLYQVLEDATVETNKSSQLIASLVQGMSSSTVQAPRNLSQSLVRRLEEIEVANNGEVVLHNRLFAQWMHQAFPRECPYPHLIGTTTSLGPKAWSELNGLDFRIDKEGASTRMTLLNRTIEQLELEFSDSTSMRILQSEGDDLMWSSEEETFIVPSISLFERVWYGTGFFFNRGAILTLPVLGAVVALAAKFKPMLHASKVDAPDSVFV